MTSVIERGRVVVLYHYLRCSQQNGCALGPRPFYYRSVRETQLIVKTKFVCAASFYLYDNSLAEPPPFSVCKLSSDRS